MNFRDINISQFSLQKKILFTIVTESCISAIGNLCQYIRHLIHSPTHLPDHETVSHDKHCTPFLRKLQFLLVPSHSFMEHHVILRKRKSILELFLTPLLWEILFLELSVIDQILQRIVCKPILSHILSYLFIYGKRFLNFHLFWMENFNEWFSCH